MFKNLILVLITIPFFIVSCQKPLKEFKEEGLNDVVVDSEGQEITFREVLENNKGRTLVLYFWAAWCGDCVKGLPKLRQLEKEVGDKADFLFFSLDRSLESFKKGYEKYHPNSNAAQYLVKSGWKGPLCKSIKMNWIPRYIVVAPDGSISLFKATKGDDKRILKNIVNQ